MRTSISKSCLLQWNIVLASYVSFFQPGRMYCLRNLIGRNRCGRFTMQQYTWYYTLVWQRNMHIIEYWKWFPICFYTFFKYPKSKMTLKSSLRDQQLPGTLSPCLVHVATLTFQNSSCIDHSLTAKITLPLDSSFGTRVHAKVVAQRIFCMEDAQMHKHFQRHNSSVGRWKL